VRQKVRLPTTLASLNSDHSFDLRAYYVGMRSSSRPNLVPPRPLHFRNIAWRSLFVVNLNSTTLGRTPAIEMEAHAIAGRCNVVMMTLAHNLIWPCTSSVLSHYTSSFSVSPSLASKPMKHRLNLHYFWLGTSTKVSIARLTTWCTFLAITMVHLGFFPTQPWLWQP